MAMMTFDRVQASVTVAFVCAGCKKRRSRSTTVWHTINPFNVDAHGVQKTPARVRTDVDREAREWKRKMEIARLCATCERLHR